MPRLARLDDPLAWRASLAKAKLHAGQSILVNGASGSVGTAAVQHARAFGATVTAVCSGANEALVRSLGAEEVIDYTKQDFTRNGQTYDVIFDAVGTSSFSRCHDALNRGGVYLTAASSLRILLQMAWTKAFGNRKAMVAFTGLRPAREKLNDLRYVIELVTAAKMVPVVDTHLPAAPDRRRAPVRRHRTQARQRPCHPDQRGLATGRSGGSAWIDSKRHRPNIDRQERGFLAHHPLHRREIATEAHGRIAVDDGYDLHSLPRAEFDDEMDRLPGGAPEIPVVTFADIGGMDRVKDEIRMKIVEPMRRPGLYRAYGKSIGGGILMYGPPGCGKTHLARGDRGRGRRGFHRRRHRPGAGHVGRQQRAQPARRIRAGPAGTPERPVLRRGGRARREPGRDA